MQKRKKKERKKMKGGKQGKKRRHWDQRADILCNSTGGDEEEGRRGDISKAQAISEKLF
jgi:hypothetical protein